MYSNNCSNRKMRFHSMFTMRCQNKGGGDRSLTREPNEFFFSLVFSLSLWRRSLEKYWVDFRAVFRIYCIFIESGTRLCDVIQVFNDQIEKCQSWNLYIKNSSSKHEIFFFFFVKSVIFSSWIRIHILDGIRILLGYGSELLFPCHVKKVRKKTFGSFFISNQN